MILKLIDQTGYRRVLLYALPIALYCLVSYMLNRLMMPEITLLSVLAFELFFGLICFAFAGLIQLTLKRDYWLPGLFCLVHFSFLMSVGAYHLLYQGLPYLGLSIAGDPEAFDRSEFAQNCILGLFRAFTYGLIYVILRQLKKEAKGLIAETERRLAEERRAKLLEQERNAYLQAALAAQISPHFAQNSFNMLAAKAAEHGHEELLDLILQLSQLMAYSASVVQPEKRVVSVATEMNKLKAFLSLICAKHGSDEVVDLQVRGKQWPQNIPPLVLITFLENADKYGDISVEHPLRIRIASYRGKFIFSCRNDKRPRRPHSSSTGIGLENVRQRLRLLMPGRFRLDIRNPKESFTITLKLNL